MPALRRISLRTRARVRVVCSHLSMTPLIFSSWACSAERFTTNEAEATSAEGERDSSTEKEVTRSRSGSLDTIRDAAVWPTSAAETPSSVSRATHSESAQPTDAGPTQNSSGSRASSHSETSSTSSGEGTASSATSESPSLDPQSSETVSEQSIRDGGLDASVPEDDAAAGPASDAAADAAADPNATSSASTTTAYSTAGDRDATATDDTTADDTASSRGSDSSSDSMICTPTRVLRGTVRDFAESHPDMEPCEDPGVECRSETGLVQTTLGSDGKPRLSSERREGSSVKDATTFAQWFNDVDGVNASHPFDLNITVKRYRVPQVIGYDSSNPPLGSPPGFDVDPKGFFPIDDQNDSGLVHNYHFTYEVVAAVAYEGGETLTVRGDDDIFVFLNRRLVIDLGGIHGTQEATVRFDDIAEEFGLVPGNVYDFRLFFAERHVEGSNLAISTTAEFMACQ